MILALILICSLGAFLLGSDKKKTTIKSCYSKNCSHNRKGKCNLAQIDIYDNEVLGLCLWHTESMTARVMNPLKVGRAIGEQDGKILCADAISQAIEKEKDQKAIKDPNYFAKLMKKWVK